GRAGSLPLTQRVKISTAQEPIKAQIVARSGSSRGVPLTTAGLQPQPDDESGAVGQFLTFVVPALNGCNLRCSFCLVRQRHEIAETHLGPEDLVRFIREAGQRAPIFALAIQGYEPLLPESLPYTQAILATGRFLNLPTTLVTNGTRLEAAADLLKTLAPTKV